MLRIGSKLLLCEPAAVEALLAQATTRPLTVERGIPVRPNGGEPRLEGHLRNWAAEYGFSLEQVEQAVRTWSDQVRANREKSSTRQQALAEFAARHFDRASELFEETARSEEATLDRIEAERKERERMETGVLQGLLNDSIGAAAALTERQRYDDASRVLENATKRVDRERYPALWAEISRNLRDAGTERASLRSAVAAYQMAQRIRSNEASPRVWAATQNNLGIAYCALGERLSNPESAASFRSAIAAHFKALEVRTKYPSSIDDLSIAEMIYLQILFRFDRAFEVNARRIQLGDGEFDFIATHLTTGRFDECASRASKIQNVLTKQDRVAITALSFACLWAAQKSEDARTAGRQLLTQAVGLVAAGWSFDGVKFFIGQHPAFAAHSRAWVQLFEGLEQADETKLRDAITALGILE